MSKEKKEAKSIMGIVITIVVIIAVILAVACFFIVPKIMEIKYNEFLKKEADISREINTKLANDLREQKIVYHTGQEVIDNVVKEVFKDKIKSEKDGEIVLKNNMVIKYVLIDRQCGPLYNADENSSFEPNHCGYIKILPDMNDSFNKKGNWFTYYIMYTDDIKMYDFIMT